jgi:hypothetical protein
VPYALIATNFNKALYVRLNFPPEVTFHFVLFVNNIPKLTNLPLTKFLNSNARIDTSGSQDALA